MEVERPSQGGLSLTPGASWNATALPLETDVYTPSPTMRRVTEVEFYLRDGAPDTIRTCGLHLRRVALYPAELRAHFTSLNRIDLRSSTDSNTFDGASRSKRPTHRAGTRIAVTVHKTSGELNALSP